MTGRSANASGLALVRRILALPRWHKRAIALTLDVASCAFSVLFAFYLRVGIWVSLNQSRAAVIVISVALLVPLFVGFGLYRTIFRYAESTALVAITKAVAVYGLLFASIYTLVGVQGVPRTIGLIQPMLVLLLVCSSRALVRMVLSVVHLTPTPGSVMPRVLVYGAGSAGRQLASAIRTSGGMKLLGFIDDDQHLWGSTLNGQRIWSSKELPSVANRLRITDILLAIPSARRARRSEIVRQLRELQLHVRTLPAVLDLARGQVAVSDLKDLEIEDLLGREPVAPHPELIGRNISDKVALVTGAGGSIGSELCRQIAAAQPATLLLVDNGEHNLYAIHSELTRWMEQHDTRFALVPLLASVQDERRMREIIATWRPDIIFHAAAYKHVPMVEHNPIDGIRNNVFGTWTCATLAIEHKVPSFVLVSTDKAVRPTNIMGASKRLAEMILQALQLPECDTCLSMVRFGNVLGSSGSVVPLFRRQISEGGPITITHPEMTRYFMTIPEAAQLVIQAGAMATGGDVFVLDMGEPVRILDLARNMIELSGLAPGDAGAADADIEIKIVGLRPGEKLYEELLIGDDPTPTDHPRVSRAREKMLPLPELRQILDSLAGALAVGDAARARGVLRSAVDEYVATTELVDWVAHQRAQHPRAAADIISDLPEDLAGAA